MEADFLVRALPAGAGQLFEAIPSAPRQLEMHLGVDDLDYSAQSVWRLTEGLRRVPRSRRTSPPISVYVLAYMAELLRREAGALHGELRPGDDPYVPFLMCGTRRSYYVGGVLQRLRAKDPNMAFELDATLGAMRRAGIIPFPPGWPAR